MTTVLLAEQEPLPEDPAWWDLFKVNKADMYEVARQVNVLFTMPKVQYISVHSFSSKQLQSPKGSETAKDPAVVSPAPFMLFLGSLQAVLLPPTE